MDNGNLHSFLDALRERWKIACIHGTDSIILDMDGSWCTCTTLDEWESRS